jgi:hypothetical protein
MAGGSSEFEFETIGCLAERYTSDIKACPCLVGFAFQGFYKSEAGSPNRRCSQRSLEKTPRELSNALLNFYLCANGCACAEKKYGWPASCLWV